MMFVIASSDPVEAVEYLVKNTSKRFYTKQLLELGQLVSSAGISNVYKKVLSGKEIQEWIKNNIHWTCKYYGELLKYCLVESKYNYSPCTVSKFYAIYKDLEKECLGIYINQWEPETAIFRYSKNYFNSRYPTNSEISLRECVKEYRKYLRWKFK